MCIKNYDIYRGIIMGIFGNLFDFNNDGRLDALEQGAEFGFFMQMINAQKQDELSAAGLDPQELEQMGYYERREAIQNAGLNPDDYDV